MAMIGMTVVSRPMEKPVMMLVAAPVSEALAMSRTGRYSPAV